MPAKKERRTQERRSAQQAKAAVDRRKEQRRQDRERRTELRVPIDLWMEEVRGDEVYFRRSCNLSEGGVLFDQAIPYPLGTRLQLRFTLPGDLEPMTAYCEVVSAEVVSAAQEKNGLGMGIKFLDLGAVGRAHIRTHLQSVLSRRKKRSEATPSA